jgi:hypothetical protein
LEPINGNSKIYSLFWGIYIWLDFFILLNDEKSLGKLITKNERYLSGSPLSPEKTQIVSLDPNSK